MLYCTYCTTYFSQELDDVYHDVSAVVGTYFDALHYCDTDKLQVVFHPRAIYATADEDPPLYRNMDEYVPVVASRQCGHQPVVVFFGRFMGMVAHRWPLLSRYSRGE